MNLRILKKLSKRAAPYLSVIDCQQEQFIAKKGENYHSTVIRDRACYERMRCMNGDVTRQGDIKKPAKDGNGWIGMWPPAHPLKGTPMVGGMSGYYEPEWDEETAWDALRENIYWHFIEIDQEGEPVPTRDLRTPSQIFAAAAEIAACRRSAPVIGETR